MKRAVKTLIFVFAFVVLGGLSAGLYYFHFDMKPGIIKGIIASMAPPPASVAATTAKQDHWVPGLYAVGSVRAYQGIDVSSQLGGVVAAIHIGSGQDVAKGAPLYDLDTGPEHADLKSFSAILKNAEIALTRQQQLITGGNTARANLDTAEAARDQAQASVERVKAIIAQKTLLAPFAGRLGIRKLDVGQYVGPGTSLITLQQLDPIFVDFPVPEQSLEKLKYGEEVDVKVDAYPGTTFKGKIDLVDARIASESRSVMVRALFANPDKRLLPGMFSNVEVIAGQPGDVVVLPRTAVSFSLYGDSVYVLTPKPPAAKPGSAQAAEPGKNPPKDASGKPIMVATRRFVRTGEVKGDEVAILDGVKPGETVIAEGQIKLQNGADVVIDPNARLIAPAIMPKE